MSFTLKNWVDSPSTTTPLSAAAIEDLETRVTDYADLRLQGTALNVVEDYGAVAGADSTSAIQNAINDALAADVVPTIVFPPGEYLCDDLDVVTDRGLRLVGIGGAKTNATGVDAVGLPQITHTGTGILFDLGTFDSTPANYWVGEAAGFAVENLRFYNNAGQAEGSRTRTAIRDNGSGDVTIRGCEFEAFEYAFAASYGSDFTVIERSFIVDCDVGIYLGPGSEQVDISTIAFYFCMEGVVADSAPQGRMESCWFQDSRTVDVQFEYPATSRFGLGGDRTSYNNLSWVLESCWHESNANGDNVRASSGHICTVSDTATYPRRVRVFNPHLVAGGSGSANRSFWEVTNGRFLTLESLLVDGSEVVYGMNRGAGASKLFQKNVHTVDGYTAVVPFRNENNECRYEDVFAPTDSVASASTITLPNGKVVVTITGNTNINTITASWSGRIVTLVFASNPTVIWAGGGGTNIYPAGSANFSATANDRLTLQCDGTEWYEVARTVI